MDGASYHLDEGERDVENRCAVRYVGEDVLSQLNTSILRRI